MANASVRRSSTDWARLVREWKRSGQTLAEFAGARGVAPASLTWWRWRLKRGRSGADGGRSTRRAPKVGLVRVEVAEPSAQSLRPEPVWELTGPSGHRLRVYEAASAELLRAVELVVAGNER
jgi:hypothetical protein